MLSNSKDFNNQIKNSIFITKASLMIGDYKYTSNKKKFVSYPKSKKVYLLVSFVIDKAVEKNLGFIYITPSEYISPPVDYQHVTKLNQRNFFFKLSVNDFNLLDKFKIAAFETSSESTFHPTRKGLIYISSLIVDSIPVEQVQLASFIFSKDEKKFISLLTNLGQALFKSKEEGKIPENFLCIITHDIMNDPVICTLDRNTYEKSIITEWLTKHRTAPGNRVPMDENQTIDDVLIPDERLRNDIKFFREKNPELLNESNSIQVVLK